MESGGSQRARCRALGLCRFQSQCLAPFGDGVGSTPICRYARPLQGVSPAVGCLTRPHLRGCSGIDPGEGLVVLAAGGETTDHQSSLADLDALWPEPLGQLRPGLHLAHVIQQGLPGDRVLAVRNQLALGFAYQPNPSGFVEGVVSHQANHPAGDGSFNGVFGK